MSNGTKLRTDRFATALSVLVGLALFPFLSWAVWSLVMVLALAVPLVLVGATAIRQCRRDETSAGLPVGLLSMEEFAKRCAEYAKPKIDPHPDLPDPLPVALRDPGFRKLIERGEELDSLEKQGRDLRREIHSIAMMDRLRDARRTLDKKRKELDTEPFVAERRFEAVTHCQHGHIGDHWVGERSERSGRHVVGRTCRYTKCGATWLEGAFMLRAVEDEQAS